jgi:ribosome maturation factor RimP
MESITRVKELLNAYLENGKFFVVDLSISNSKRNPTLLLLLDSDEGITIDECAKISRKLGNDIEAENIFETPFVLEVSSPGVDTPLINARQYAKNVGRTIKFTKIDGEKIVGELKSFTENGVVILEEVLKGKLKVKKKEDTELNFDQIKSAQVQISFS